MRRHVASSVRWWVVAFAALASGCQTNLGTSGGNGIQSLRVKLMKPNETQLGQPTAPIMLKTVTVDVAALGPDGQVFTGQDDIAVDVFLSYSGNKVGRLSPCGIGDDSTPLQTVHLKNGVLDKPIDVTLFRAFGKANVWFEAQDSHAVGTTPDIYFPQFSIPDLQGPFDPTTPATTDAYCSPYNGRYINVDHATGSGQLVVTSVFGSAYVIGDTGAPYTVDPMGKISGGYNHLYVFTFGRPPADAKPGRILNFVSGNFSKFNGFSELNFPLQDISNSPDSVSGAPIVAKVPAPVVLDPNQDTGTETAPLLRLTAATVKMTGVVCPVDPTLDSWKKYNQFTLQDNARTMPCSTFGSFAVELPGKTFGDFNPLTSGGATITITGMLRNSSGQNDACKGIGPPVDCATTADCGKAASNPQYSAACQAKLMGASVSCVEGTCRRGAFNFWTVVPRDVTDIVVTK